MSGSVCNCVSLLKGRILVLPAISLVVFIHSNCLGQREYYQYNNPDAIKIRGDVLARLTANEWSVIDIRWLIRKDTFDYGGRGASLKLNKNLTYNSGRLQGTWQIKYNRYLVLTDTNRVLHNKTGISGTFGITSFTDSMLVLQKIHTSSRDMSTTMTLVKYGSVHKPFKRSAPRVLTSEEKRLYNESRRRALRNVQVLHDSLRFLSKEELTFLGYREANDTLFINSSDVLYGKDSLYRVPLERSNPFKKVKIFYDNENVADLEAYQRFTLSADQLPLIDSLAMNYIRQHRNDYYPQKEIKMGNYFRQYVGYFDVDGDAIVFLNASCQYKNSWQDSLVQVGLGGVCYFNISVNLSRRQAFSFHVNDF